MVLKLVLKFIVILSLINSIQCACKGLQPILDAITESKSSCLDAINDLKSDTLDAIDEVKKRIKTLEEQINSSCPIPDPNMPVPPSKY